MANIEVTVTEIIETISVGVTEIVEEVTINVIEGGGSDLSISEGSGTPSGDPGTGPKAYQNTDTGEWWRWNGSSWVPSVGAGAGDMLISIYDPTNVSGDVFDMDNMVEGVDTKIMTAAERTAIANNTSKISDSKYTHNQPLPSASWNITHGLSKFPSVDVVDTGGNLVEGDIKYIDSNNVIITFSASFAGKAYFN
jgi:hypothetical protein